MSLCRLPENDVVLLVELGDEEVVEGRSTRCCVDILEPDVVTGQGVGNEEQPMLKAKGSAGDFVTRK